MLQLFVRICIAPTATTYPATDDRQDHEVSKRTPLNALLGVGATDRVVDRLDRSGTRCVGGDGRGVSGHECRSARTVPGTGGFGPCMA